MEYKEFVEIIDIRLHNLFNGLRVYNKYHETNLLEAMEYSVMNGGKRIRPILVVLGARFQGGRTEDVIELALAMELIHSYSLIHDDLPCMDDDELRRGRPTTHIKYGEATALLAGDALLNLAMELAVKGLIQSSNKDNYSKALNLIFKRTGYNGMIGGQAQDLLMENDTNGDYTSQSVLSMYEGKTASLLIASLCAGAMAVGVSSNEYDDLKSFAYNLGIAFQIKDDLLEITSTPEKLGKSISDKDNNKTTIIKAVGLEQAKALFEYYNSQAFECIEKYGDRACELKQLYELLITRDK